MGQEILKKIDRYFLLDCIAQGGMAEIFRARPTSAEGKGRIVVIKRILSGQDRNKDFHKMFQSELKVMMGFNHANIVSLFDFGSKKGQRYIAMEYVDGKNLRQFLSKAGETNELMPIEICVHIIANVAAGLHYAHGFKDKITGEHLGVVHRDVSPQNILVAYDGAIKIIDFGIAKAKSNVENTRVGVIKGKPSYLSPEQIAGKALDARSDIFSLGTVLWETLTGRKLFAAKAGDNEFAVLKLIESCESHVKPPSSINPEVPAELDFIVLKSLAKKREERYQSCDEFLRALRKFVNTIRPDFDPAELAYCAKNLFKNEIVNDRKRLQYLTAKAEQLLEKDLEKLEEKEMEDSKILNNESGQKIAPVRNDEGTRTFKGNASTGAKNIDVTGTDTEKELVELDGPSNYKKRVSKTGSSFKSLGTHQTPTRPKDAFRPKRISRPQKKSGFKRYAGVAVLLVAAAFLIKLPSSEVTTDRTPDSVGQPSQESLDSIILRMKFPMGFAPINISVDGETRVVNKGNETTFRVPLNQSMQLKIEREQFKTFTKEFAIDGEDARGLQEWLFRVPLEPVSKGFVSITTTPSAQAEIKPINRMLASTGNKVVLDTPVEREELPTGKYKLHLVNRVLGMQKDMTIEIKSGRTIRIDERLELKQ